MPAVRRASGRAASRSPARTRSPVAAPTVRPQRSDPSADDAVSPSQRPRASATKRADAKARPRTSATAKNTAASGGGPSPRTRTRNALLITAMFIGLLAVLVAWHQRRNAATPAPSQSSPHLRSPPPHLPVPDDDDEILCDCGWTRWPGQSCEETRGKAGFPCWPECCAQA